MDEADERDFIKQFAALKLILNKKENYFKINIINYKIKEYIYRCCFYSFFKTCVIITDYN